MKKTVNLLAIISMAISALGLIIGNVYAYFNTYSVITYTRMPIGTILAANIIPILNTLMLVLFAVLLITALQKSRNFVGEIVFLGVLYLAAPTIGTVIFTIISRTVGTDYIQYYNMLQQFSFKIIADAVLAAALSFSIATKVITKNQTPAA